MYTEGFEQWFKLNKNISSPINDMSKLATQMSKHISEQNLQLIEENIARFSSQLKRLSNVKRPDEFLTVQREILNENFTTSIEMTQKLIHMAMENFEEVSRIWGSTAAKISEKAVEKAQKFAEKAEKPEKA